MPFAIGENVGPYKIIEQLGQGGMAIVYRAYHSTLDRDVAIKVLSVDLGDISNFLERFEQEARVLAQLEGNPCIVPIYSIGRKDEQPYLVLKYIGGQTLKDQMQIFPIRKDKILNIIEAVANGLQFAHERGILHRDIKPSNILMSNDGQVYLSDFGLAKIISKASSLTGDRIIGTPQYMSPEQAKGEENLDKKTDIYSLGVMIYELVTGHLPFQSASPLRVIEDHIFAPVPLPTVIKPDLSREVEGVLLRALSKQRDDRHESVQELVLNFRQAWLSYLATSTYSLDKSDQFPQIAVLRAQNGDFFPLRKEIVILGRRGTTQTNLNDIDLSELDSAKLVSRRHAMIQFQNGIFLIVDLNSRNGTFVNGKHLNPQQIYRLGPGDIIQLGRRGVTLSFFYSLPITP